MTICVMLKFIGEVAVVVIALTGEVFTGVVITDMSCVGGITWVCCCGGAATGSELPTNPSPPPSKSGGSCTA